MKLLKDLQLLAEQTKSEPKPDTTDLKKLAAFIFARAEEDAFEEADDEMRAVTGDMIRKRAKAHADGINDKIMRMVDDLIRADMKEKHEEKKK